MSYAAKRVCAKIIGVVLAVGLIVATVFLHTRAEGAFKDDQEWKAPARAARKKNPVPADDASITRGQAVYVKECASCHGDNGKGDGPAAKDLDPKPRDLRDPKIWEQTDGALFWKLTEGRKPMPSYEKLLGEDDRWNVINYIHRFAPEGNSPASQPK